MKQSQLQTVFEQANFYQKIDLAFVRRVSQSQMPNVNGGIAMLEHFARTQRLLILETNEAAATAVVVKTQNFKPQDAAALAEAIFGLVESASFRGTQEYTITLELGEAGWQLEMKGGNKLLRTAFVSTKDTIDAHPELTPVKVTSAFQKNGVAVLTLESQSEDEVLKLAEHVAAVFETPLIF